MFLREATPEKSHPNIKIFYTSGKLVTFDGFLKERQGKAADAKKLEGTKTAIGQTLSISDVTGDRTRGLIQYKTSQNILFTGKTVSFRAHFFWERWDRWD